jgi:hypothetical protein
MGLTSEQAKEAWAKRKQGSDTPDEDDTKTLLDQMLEELKSLREDNQRMKARMWNDQKAEEPKYDPEDLKMCTVLYGYGKVGAHERVWVGGSNGTTWEFIGGVCRNVPWSVAKHWQHNTRPDGMPVLGFIDCVILPNDATEADFAREIGLPPKSIEETAAIIAATDLTKLVDALPQNMRDLLMRRLQQKQ